MIASRRAKASSCRRRSGVSASSGHKGEREPVRRAVALQIFGYGLLAEHQIGEDHGVDVRHQAEHGALPRRNAVSGDGRNLRQRELERHGA